MKLEKAAHNILPQTEKDEEMLDFTNKTFEEMYDLIKNNIEEMQNRYYT